MQVEDGGFMWNCDQYRVVLVPCCRKSRYGLAM
eukprot:COSAG01_NODE_57295_length_313_cov_0.714953_1_plen_32_part_01